MNELELMQRLEEAEALLADGFEDALIGITENHHHLDVAVYDYDKAVDILMLRDGMGCAEAIEFMEYNVLGAYVGKNTPMFVSFTSKNLENLSVLSVN